jgi:hypothetical protein
MSVMTDKAVPAEGSDEDLARCWATHELGWGVSVRCDKELGHGGQHRSGVHRWVAEIYGRR